MLNLKYTLLYPLLAKGAYKAKLKVYINPSASETLTAVKNVLTAAHKVNEAERKAGNTITATKEYDYEAMLENDPRRSLQLEIDAAIEGTSNLVKFMEAGKLSTDIHKEFDYRSEAGTAVTGLDETVMVPLASNPADLADYLNFCAKAFVEETKGLTADKLNNNKGLKDLIKNAASDILLNITEDPNPQVDTRLADMEDLINRWNELDIPHGQDLVAYLAGSKSGSNEEAELEALLGLTGSPGDKAQNTSIF